MREHYLLGGLRVASDLPLPGVATLAQPDTAQREVLIRRGSLPRQPATIATIRDGQYSGEYDGRQVLLEIPRVGSFLLRCGNEILVDTPLPTDDGELRACLLGTAFGLLCHQRGITPLHASSIEINDGCVAFVGASGAGKSTLLAALAQRGSQVFADDVCFLRLDAKAVAHVWPGMSRIRLWEEAISALDCAVPGMEREVHGSNKYFIPTPPRENPGIRSPLHRIYLLDE